MGRIVLVCIIVLCVAYAVIRILSNTIKTIAVDYYQINDDGLVARNDRQFDLWIIVSLVGRVSVCVLIGVVMLRSVL